MVEEPLDVDAVDLTHALAAANVARVSTDDLRSAADRWFRAKANSSKLTR